MAHNIDAALLTFSFRALTIATGNETDPPQRCDGARPREDKLMMTIRFSSRGLLACIIATAAACSGNDGAQEFDARLLGPIDASPLPAVDANPQSVIDASAVSIDAQRAQSDGALAFDASRPVDAGIVDAKPVSDAAPSLTTVTVPRWAVLSRGISFFRSRETVSEWGWP